MTTELDLERVRRDNTASLALLRAVPDPLALMRSGAPVDRATAEVLPTVWELWSGSIEDDNPVFVVGIKAAEGVLKWYEGQKLFVPQGVSERGEWHEYWFAGDPMGFYEGEELPIEYVWAAVGEFIGTGERPTVISWSDADEVPYRRDDDPGQDDQELTDFLRAVDSAAMELGVASDGGSTRAESPDGPLPRFQ